MNYYSHNLILALDGKPWNELLPLLEQLRNTGVTFKINDLALEKSIDELIPALREYGNVMVDLKWHDIPKTVSNYGKLIRKHNPWAVTVHASGGAGMIKALATALQGMETKILAVTLLTSLESKDSEEIYGSGSIDQVKKLATIAIAAGAHGLVCSSQEVSILRNIFPNALLVVPSIRTQRNPHEQGRTPRVLPNSNLADGRRILGRAPRATSIFYDGVPSRKLGRTGTPYEAIAAGANYIVMGRDIIDAKNPMKILEKVLGEISRET